MEEHPHTTDRSAAIDAFRGVAVAGMLVAHAIFFFHNGGNPVLSQVERLLNTTVLTGFVFIAGLSLSRFLDAYGHVPTRGLIPPALRRLGILYLVYAVTAVVAVATQSPAPSPLALMLQIGRALALIGPPNFTEYLPLFLLFAAATIPLRTLYRWTRQSALLTVLAGTLAYILGTILYPMAVPGLLDEIKKLFAGGGTALRFPFLFYFPVFILGLWWQHQTDHPQPDKPKTATRTGLVMVASGITIASMLIKQHLEIPALDPAVRWPPSIAFLSAGMSLTGAAILLLPALRGRIGRIKSVITYFGRDALDLWMNHLILLFVYRRFINLHFDGILEVAGLTLVVIILATAMSSVRLTNAVRFPLQFILHGSSRFRKRYAVVILLTLVLMLSTVTSQTASSSTAGNVMTPDPFTVVERLPQHTRLRLSTDRIWFAPELPEYNAIHARVRATDPSGKTLDVAPTQITLHLGTNSRRLQADRQPDGTLHFLFPISDIAPGTYTLHATAETTNGKVSSDTITVYLTQPLLVAWTFDWEGWDVPDSVLTAIDALSTPYRKPRFTHFVSPRTFLDGILSRSRRDALASYLQARHAGGDEIALHLHMHYDLVRAAGVTPRTTRAWGLRSAEGYDVPATEYTPEEFVSLIAFSKTLMRNAGLPDPVGYRSGGWFANAALLRALKTQEFLYDSSGRDRPSSGAFTQLPWNLPVGAQPYYPGSSDQNSPAPDNTGILEIPNNGVTTYESSLSELVTRAKTLYSTGILTNPKTLVYTSHPQFAQREFATIPQMLTYFDNMSLAANRGPVIYATMSEIYSLWTSSR